MGRRALKEPWSWHLRIQRSGAGGFAGEAGNEIHEQLGQFHVVNRQTAERRNALFAIGAVVAAARQNTRTGYSTESSAGNSRPGSAGLSDVDFALLEIRICR